MSGHTVKLACSGGIALAFLGGCAGTSRVAQSTYARVPCDTPGALPTEALKKAAALASAMSAQFDQRAGDQSVSPDCVVAVSNPSYPPAYAVGRFSFKRGFGFGHFDGNHRGHEREVHETGDD